MSFNYVFRSISNWFFNHVFSKTNQVFLHPEIITIIYVITITIYYYRYCEITLKNKLEITNLFDGNLYSSISVTSYEVPSFQ